MKHHFFTKSLAEDEELLLRQKQATCEHKHWIKACSHCRAILSTEKLEEKKKSEEIMI